MKLLNDQHLVDVPMYLTETYFTLYPNADMDDFHLHVNNTDVMTQTSMANRNRTSSTPYTGVRRVILNEQYLNWLAKHKKRNSTRNRNEYMSTLTDKEVEQLWKENDEYRVTGLTYVPVVFLTKKSRPINQLIMTQEMINEVETFAKKAMHSDDVAVFPQFLRVEDIDDDFESNFMESVVAKLVYQKKVQFSPIKGIPSVEKVNIEIRFISIGSQYQEPVFQTIEEQLAEISREPSEKDTDALSAFLSSKYRGFDSVIAFNLFVEDPEEAEDALFLSLIESAIESE